MSTYTELKPFRFWCQKVLPLVYDDSLSYYELLNKVVGYLNTTMENVDYLHDEVTDMYEAWDAYKEEMLGEYTQLVHVVNTLESYVNYTYETLTNEFERLGSYVENYFDNLDVQTEIDNKLDEMAQDGTLTALLQAAFDEEFHDYVDAQLAEINEDIDEFQETVNGQLADMNDSIDTIEEQVSNLTVQTTNNLSGWEITELTVSAAVQNMAATATFNNVPHDAVILEAVWQDSAGATGNSWLQHDVIIDRTVGSTTDTIQVAVNNLTTQSANINIKLTLGTQESVAIPELTDIRVGINGAAYPTAGDAVRNQIGAIAQASNMINLFDGDFDESGYIDATTGEDASSANFKRTSKYYPIIGDRTLGKLYGYLSVSIDAFSVLFYDSNKDYISFVNYNNVTTKENVLPANASYFRVYTKTAYSGNVTLSLSYVSSYVPYEIIINLKDNIVSYEKLDTDLQNLFQMNAGTNLFDGNFDESGYINPDTGANASSNDFKRTSKYYPIGSNYGSLYGFISPTTDVFTVCFYNGLNEYVGYVNYNNAQTKTNDLPADAKYFRVYVRTAYSGNVTLSLTPVSSYIPYEEHYGIANGSIEYDMFSDSLKRKLDKTLAGKTIAFMGDSVIGNVSDSTGICAVLSEKTGANVINCAFGGTRMAYEYSQYGDATPTASGFNPGTTPVEQNQVTQYRYWNTLSGIALADAIISDVWTLQENAIANMTGTPAYFSTRLAEIKAVDWSTVDFIMWEYGTNDFMTRVKPIGSDRFAYDYAYRQAIEEILTEYPNIRIITATPIYRWYIANGSFSDDSNTHTENDYTGTSHTLKDFVAVANNVSKEYQLPCIDEYYTLGANRYTRLAYFDSNDGTHPNANGRKRIGEHLGGQLMTLV